MEPASTGRHSGIVSAVITQINFQAQRNLPLIVHKRDPGIPLPGIAKAAKEKQCQ